MDKYVKCTHMRVISDSCYFEEDTILIILIFLFGKKLSQTSFIYQFTVLFDHSVYRILHRYLDS